MIKRNLIWIENIYDKFSLPYYFVSVIVSIILLLIFIIFYFIVPMLKSEFWYDLVIVTMCSLIALQQIAIIYILKCCRDTIRNLDFVTDKYFLCNSYYNFISIYKMKWIIPVNLLVIIPFFIIDILQFSKGDLPLFFTWMGTIGSLSLDLYNYFLSYLINYFLSIQLFVNLSIVYLIRGLDIGGYKNYINLDDLETKNVKIAKLLSVSSAVYFLSLSLAIITYMGPFGIFTIQSVIYMALIFLGLLLFLIGRRYLGKIFTDRLQDEKDKLLNIDKPYYEKFVKNVA